MENKFSPLPVVLVSGFLGAGKTTLMRHLIRDAAGRGLRAALVVNEFGVADVDSSILREADAELLGSLAGGCACCTGQEELLFTLMEIGENHRKAQREGGKITDVLFIEASGLADPVLMFDALTVAHLLPLLRIASAIAVVDASRLPEIRRAEAGATPSQLTPLLTRQVALADIIALNKIDVAFRTEERATNEREGMTRLREISPDAVIYPTKGANISTEELWARVAETKQGARQLERSPMPYEAGEAAHAHYQTIVVPMNEPIGHADLEHQLRTLGTEVWRAKGFLKVEGIEGLCLMQYTGAALTGEAVCEVTRFQAPPSYPTPDPNLVFIGPHLDRGKLMRDFGRRNVVTLL